jgi:hypothetical protein
MDLQKMAFEFAAAIMQVIQEATLEELTGASAPKKKAKPRKAFIPGANVVAAVAGAPAMASKKNKTLKSAVAPKKVAAPKKKAPVKKVAKRSHKKKVSR